MKISRRAFIKGCIGTAVAGAVFRPQPAKAANPRVIGLYDASATTYVSGGNWYSNSYVDQSSGVSVRMTISLLECLISNAERRAIQWRERRAASSNCRRA